VTPVDCPRRPRVLKRSGVEVSLKEGSQIDRFKLLKRVPGSMDRVYKAQDPSTGEFFAFKLPGSEDPDEESRRQFLAQIEALRRLGTYPRIASYVTDGVVDGIPYVVTEWIYGENLHKLLVDRKAAEKPPLSQTAVIEIGVQVADALVFAYSKSLLHRDVKPENILAERGDLEPPHVRLIDYGAARDKSIERQSTSIVGTPQYWAPERWPDNADQAIDQYALGLTLFELLTYEVPLFVLGNHAATAELRRTSPAPSVREKNRQLSEALDNVLQRMLQPVPDERYPDPYKVLEAFTALSDGLGLAPTPFTMRVPPPRNGTLPPPPSAPPLPTAEPVVAEAVEAAAVGSATPSSRPRFSRRAWLAPVMAAAAFLVAGGGLIAMAQAGSSGPNQQEHATPTTTLSVAISQPAAVSGPTVRSIIPPQTAVSTTLPTLRTTAVATQTPEPTATPTIDQQWTQLQPTLDRAWAASDWPNAISLLDEFLSRATDYQPARDKLYSFLVISGKRLISDGSIENGIGELERAVKLEPARIEAREALFTLTPTPTPRVRQLQFTQTSGTPLPPLQPVGSDG
jgi:serine/threonine protein kinase